MKWRQVFFWFGCSHLLSWLAERTANLSDFGVIFRGQRFLYLRFLTVDMDNRFSCWSRLCWRSLVIIWRFVCSNDRWSIDEGRSTCCLQNYEWRQTNKIGQLAFFLVRLRQDLSEKLDIWHKFSSNRFHGQNNSEFSNWFSYTSLRERCHGKNLLHVASDFIFQTSSVVQCSDCTTLLLKNICYINSSSLMFCFER